MLCNSAQRLYLTGFLQSSREIGRERKRGPDNLQVCRTLIFEPLFNKMFRPTPDGPGNLQVCRTLIFEPEKTVPARPSASLQNRVYLTTIDAFLRKFAMRCGAATLLDPTPPQVQRLRKSLHLWWSQNSSQNSAQRLHGGFFCCKSTTSDPRASKNLYNASIP